MAGGAKKTAGGERIDRTFVVGQERSQIKAMTRPAPARAGMGTKDVGLDFQGGMGLSPERRALLQKNLRPIPLGQAVGLGTGDQPLDCPPSQAGLFATLAESNAFACSLPTIDFLRVNVLRRNDIRPIRFTGAVKFDPECGKHIIPLSIGNQAGDAFPGSLPVPDGQTLIVTDFTPFACVQDIGLPGGHVSVDPCALLGQVCFFLIADNGKRLLPEHTVVEGRTCSGTEILGKSPCSSFPALTDDTTLSVRVGYEVLIPPFPGFPEVVGAHLCGYLLNTVLFAAALSDNPYSTQTEGACLPPAK